jgi:homoserine dehydrogenase
MADSLGKPLNVGLAGFGTVGSGLADVLRDNRDWVASRLGRPVRLAAVAERNPALRPAVEAHGAAFVDDWRKLADDPAIEVVVELIGGTRVAREVIRTSLEKGKHVVTANKALLASTAASSSPWPRRWGGTWATRPRWPAASPWCRPSRARWPATAPSRSSAS